MVNNYYTARIYFVDRVRFLSSTAGTYLVDHARLELKSTRFIVTEGGGGWPFSATVPYIVVTRQMPTA